MKSVMVRYKVRAGLSEANDRLIEAVYAELHAKKPSGIRYQTFRLPDGVSYMHVATIDTADGSNPLVALDAFKRFSGTIKERAEELPVTTELSEVGSYVR